ncbi:MAG: hypothetical protein NC489_44645 [Ruminococcus flavefaciens]|nr:hypothetical protein [Ruminococcus flavefaciens]
MTTVKEWSIKLDKDGMPYLVILNERYQIKKVIRLESEDVSFNQQGISFECTSRKGRTEEYVCQYKCLSREQTPSPISQLLEIGTIKGKQRHSLVFLYELLSGVVLSTMAVYQGEPLNVDALVKSYDYLEEQFNGVDFQEVASSLRKSLIDKGVDKNVRRLHD